MKHLSEMRIMELALPGASEPVNGEALHLSECERCRTLLEEERALTRDLHSMEPVSLSPDFTAKAVAVFRTQTRARGLKQLWVALTISGLLAASLVAALILAGSSVTGYLIDGFAQAGTVATAFATVVSSLPLATTCVVIGVCILGLLITLLLARLGKNHAALKYAEESSVPSGGSGE